MKAYIAGPIHSPVGVDKEVLKRRFHTLAEWLRSQYPEWEIINPLDCLPGCEGSDEPCQDRSGLPSGEGHSWECWMKGDLREMLRCDVVVLLPHWQKSRGASLEADLAQKVHMHLYLAWPIPDEPDSDGSRGWIVSG